MERVSQLHFDRASLLPERQFTESAMMRVQPFREFDNRVDAEIERSKAHWSELITSDEDEEPRESNREVLDRLKKDPKYAHFFGTDFSHFQLGPKFAEGGQAEIFAAIVPGEPQGKYALKVFKPGFALRGLQRQWPHGLLRSSEDEPGFSVAGALRIEGGMVLADDRFAFVLPRCWGDLRKLMETRLQLYKSPFEPADVLHILLAVANGMLALHEHRILHRDLKSSNVLCNFPKGVDPTMRTFRCQGEPALRGNSAPKLFVADYESSVGNAGSGFWRAPEVLQQLKDGDKNLRFTAAADVYSYGMLGYELLTGLMPFQGHPWRDYDIVLQGRRPSLGGVGMPWAAELIRRCWQHDPSRRPTFSTLVADLEQIKVLVDLSSVEAVGSSRSCIRWLTPCLFPRL